MLRDISRLYIVKQPNGKYALFNGERNEFVLTNSEGSTEIIDFVLERTEARLRCSVFTKPEFFSCALEKYKQARGFESEAVNESSDGAVELMTSMGVPEETLNKKPTGGGRDPLTIDQKLKIMELVKVGSSNSTLDENARIEEQYRLIRDLILESHCDQAT